MSLRTLHISGSQFALNKLERLFPSRHAHMDVDNLQHRWVEMDYTAVSNFKKQAARLKLVVHSGSDHTHGHSEQIAAGPRRKHSHYA